MTPIFTAAAIKALAVADNAAITLEDNSSNNSESSGMNEFTNDYEKNDLNRMRIKISIFKTVTSKRKNKELV